MEKLYRVVVGVVLCGILAGVLAVILRFMLDIGPIWSAVIVLAGVMIWRRTSTQKS